MTPTQRTFILGEEWLYYKLYCGRRTADLVLTTVIKPLTESLLSKGRIDQWFFIRYEDPSPHLRVRFHCNSIENTAVVIQMMKDQLANYVEDGTIWSVQTDMYSRELQRYGVNIIEEAEEFFYLDSQFCLQTLDMVEDDKLLFLITLRSIDGVLNLFEFDIHEKAKFTSKNFQAFKQEFNADKNLNKQLNIKHQTLREEIESILTSPIDEYSPLIRLLQNKESDLRTVVGRIVSEIDQKEITIDDYISSQIHMTVNRAFRDKQRLHELVCYSCLNRFYKSKSISK